jgi:omega-6 fatty acid desaturase (delta-12 desaturase)
MKEGWKPWASAMGTNLGLFAALGLIIWMGGFEILLLVWLPSMVLASSIGVWLFFVQHQFEGTYWQRGDTWNAMDAALHGSSHYVLPPVLRWLTANIGIHHIHHASSRIPYYQLNNVLKHNPSLSSMSRLGFIESIRCSSLALWDEAGQKLISFAHFARMKSVAVAA